VTREEKIIELAVNIVDNMDMAEALKFTIASVEAKLEGLTDKHLNYQDSSPPELILYTLIERKGIE